MTGRYGGFEMGTSAVTPDVRRSYSLALSEPRGTYLEYPTVGVVAVRIGEFGVRGIAADGSVVWESGPVEIVSPLAAPVKGRGTAPVLDEAARNRLNSAIVMASCHNLGYVVPTGDVDALDAVLNPVCEVVADLLAEARAPMTAPQSTRQCLATIVTPGAGAGRQCWLQTAHPSGYCYAHRSWRSTERKKAAK